MNENPLVTINILSFNRKDELRNTLSKIYEQDYKNIEVIVVDNDSTDGTQGMVKRDYPSVTLIELNKNIGVAGWNEGFAIAKGEYVLVLDDDAYPEHDSISKAIKEFYIDDKIACVSFDVYDIREKRYLNNNWSPHDIIDKEKVYWPIFIGCAAIFSAKKINIHGIIPRDYFLYQHELPVSAIIHNQGFKILFGKGIVAYHNFKDEKVYRVFNDSQSLRNNLLFINKYLPFCLVVLYTFQCILFYLSRSIRRGWFRQYISIIVNIIFRIRKREVITFEYFIQLRRLHLFNFTFLSKLI
jgi:GT2 family glycosyltransferase